MNDPDRADELTEKRRRVLGLLASRGLEAIVLHDPRTVAWYTGGARATVVESSDAGILDLIVTPAGDIVVTDAIEVDRLREEELIGFPAAFKVLDWGTPRSTALPAGARVGSDTPEPNRVDVRVDVRVDIEAVRRALTPAETIRYRILAQESAEVLSAVIEGLDPRTSEWTAAARIAGAVTERAAAPIVVLVAGARRTDRHRHPLPTSQPLGRRAMVVVCARRSGLVAGVTRLFSFGPLPPEIVDRYARLLRVESAFLSALCPGPTVGDVMTAGCSAYAANGFDPDEWRRHHQGGPTGYFPRDYLATSDRSDPVAPGQAFAWNPSATGVKVEDTVLSSATGVQILSVDLSWPTVVVDRRARPEIAIL